MGEAPELIPSAPSEFKTSPTSKIVKCSSGKIYKVGKMRLPVMATLFSSKIDFSQDFKAQLQDPVKARLIFDAIDEIVPQCVLQPRISAMPSPTSITPEDIPPIDMMELFTAILDISGYQKERVAEAEKFRKEPSGENAPGSSTEEPKPT